MPQADYPQMQTQILRHVIITIALCKTLKYQQVSMSKLTNKSCLVENYSLRNTRPNFLDSNKKITEEWTAICETLHITMLLLVPHGHVSETSQKLVNPSVLFKVWKAPYTFVPK